MRRRNANFISLIFVVLVAFSGYMIKENMELKKQITPSTDDNSVLSVIKSAEDAKNKDGETKEEGTRENKEETKEGENGTEKTTEEKEIKEETKEKITEEKQEQKQETKQEAKKETKQETKQETTTSAPQQEPQKTETKVKSASTSKVAYTKNVSQLPNNAQTSFEKDIFNRINASRAELGLNALQWNTMDARCAQVRSVECETLFSHTRPCQEAWYSIFDEYGISWSKTLGENLAYSTNVDSAYIHQILMDSDSHRAAIINPKYNYVGISAYVIKGSNGESAAVYVCEIFSEANIT